MRRIKDANGIEIYIEEHSEVERASTAFAQRRQLYSYYEKTLSYSGINLNKEESDSLKWLVDNISEQAAEKEIARLDNTYYGRLIAYSSLIHELKGHQRQSIKPEPLPPECDAKLLEIANALYGGIKYALDKGLDNLETVVVNDNIFLYSRATLNIIDYACVLYTLGKQKKGDTYYLCCDNGEPQLIKCACFYKDVVLI